MRIQHKGRWVKTPIIECFQPETDTVKGNEVIKAGDWYISAYIPEEELELRQDILNGVVTGFSIAGMGVREATDGGGDK